MLPFITTAVVTLACTTTIDCSRPKMENIEPIKATIQQNEYSITQNSFSNDAVVDIKIEDSTLAEINNELPDKQYYMVVGRSFDRLSLEEFDLLCRLVMAEAGGTSEETQRMVTETVLNRMESKTYGGNLTKVIYEPGEFEPTRNGSINNTPTNQVVLTVKKALLSKEYPSNLMYFNSIDYMWGTPFKQIDGMYFSILNE